MQENIFTEILMFNIIDSDEIINKKKELRLSGKIIDLYTKFKYYKYNIHLENEIILNIFYKSQRINNIIKSFYNKLKYNTSKVYNTEDLIGNDITNILTFDMYINKFIYKFTYENFINIIKSNLFKFNDSNNIELNNTNTFSSPLEIKNPYTNIPLNKNILYNFYLFCKKQNFNIPTVYQLYYENNFEIRDLFLHHENYLTINSIKNYIKSLDNESKFNYLIKSLIIFSQFLSKHFDNVIINFLSAEFKNNFYNLDLDDIKNYFNQIIYNYIVTIYYFKSNNSRNFVSYKLKLVLALLMQKKIKFINNKNTSYRNTRLTIYDIIDTINTDMHTILIREINDFRLLNNIEIVMARVEREAENDNDVNDNDVNDNDVNDNDVNDNDVNDNDVNDNDVNDNDVNDENIIEESNLLAKRLYKINDIYENNKLLKILSKIITGCFYLFNFYTNIFIISYIYYRYQI